MSRKFPMRATLMLVAVILIFIAACGPNIPGVSSPIQVDGGTIKVTKVERTDKLVAPDGSFGKPQPGYDILLVTVETTGTASNSDFYLSDSTGQKYQCGGLYHGSSICQVAQDSHGLTLWYGNNTQIPLSSFLGETAPSSASNVATSAVPVQVATSEEVTPVLAITETAAAGKATVAATVVGNVAVLETATGNAPAQVCPTEWPGYVATDADAIKVGDDGVSTPDLSAGSLAGTVWILTDSFGKAYELKFSDGGRLSVKGNNQNDECGSWTQNGNFVFITYNGRYVHLRGEINGNTMKGRAWNNADFGWTWTAQKQ